MAKKLTISVRRVEQALVEAFPDMRFGLERVKPTGRILGYVVSGKFRGLTHTKRQERLDKALASEFSASERVLIGPIVTMTPAEADVGDAAA